MDIKANFYKDHIFYFALLISVAFYTKRYRNKATFILNAKLLVEINRGVERVRFLSKGYHKGRV